MQPTDDPISGVIMASSSPMHRRSRIPTAASLHSASPSSLTEVDDADAETTLKDDLAKLHTVSLNEIPSAVASAQKKSRKCIPPLMKRIRWFNLMTVISTPLLALYGILTTPLRRETAILTFIWWICTTLGITAGYHRLWSHRSWTASPALQVFLAISGAASIQGSIRWWARLHRSHHRYTDTDLDPYSAAKGFWFSHIGWMLVDPLTQPGRADVLDLSKDKVVMWQRKYFFHLAFGFGVFLPLIIAGFGWGDWRGGLYYAVLARLVIVHHEIFSINSFAHWWGEKTYDDRYTPRDSALVALWTFGEGYHNFHHQFPMDYRGTIRYYEMDPTKWTIWLWEQLGLAFNLQRFSMNEIRKGRLAMETKQLHKLQNSIDWGTVSEDLPVVTWDAYQAASKDRPLILISGFIHDISSIFGIHPGGQAFLTDAIGTDASTSFFGGVFDHPISAKYLLKTMRVAALEGGVETVSEKAIVANGRLYVAEGHWND